MYSPRTSLVQLDHLKTIALINADERSESPAVWDSWQIKPELRDPIDLEIFLSSVQKVLINGPRVPSI
jgi:hypothetical protein